MRHFASINLFCALVLAAVLPAHAGFKFETPVPTGGSRAQVAPPPATTLPLEPARKSAAWKFPLLTPTLLASIESFDFDIDAAANEGNAFIPVDAGCAVGPEHVMNAGNCMIEWRTTDFLGAAPQYRSDLRTFFAHIPAPAPNPGPGTSLGTYGYNPRVLYDQYAGRFIVVMLEVWDTAAGKPSNQSRILLAISKTSDPNDGFWYHSINSKLNISGSDSFVDFPGLAVDDKAVYITGNMFSFAGKSYTGVRLWIVGKAAAYTDDDPAIFVGVRNPYASAGFVTTTIPTHMFGPPQTGSGGRPMGTFLLAYSGITDGVDEYLQITEVTDPLQTAGGPFFTLQQLDVGDIDNPSLVLPDAAQKGTAFPIETNDRRILSAVWRNDKLYCASNIRGAALTPDANQCMVRWWKLNTTNTTTLAQDDAGNITGEDIAVGTHTYYPSVMVDVDGNMAVNFTASGTSLYASAYYTTRLAGDPAGSTSVPQVLAAGVDFYRRYFGGTSNRWGNYSGIALAPDQNDFWIFGQYAGPRGNGASGDDGRWKTRLGRFRIKTVTAVPDGRIPENSLLQNVPNPFNPSTTIRFTLARSGPASLVVYDLTGAHIRTLLNEVRERGSHQLVWDGRDDRGAPVASGIYLYRLRSGSLDTSRKMVLIK